MLSARAFLRRTAIPTFLLILLLGPAPVRAEPGDTTTIRVFDNYLWTWNGGQDRWGVFPPATTRHERILMHFRLKCPTGGCGEWDYTMPIYVIEHTGRIDSSLQNAASFRINGEVRDSVPISRDTTWTYTWNATARRVDSTATTPLKVTRFTLASPWTPVDSTVYWPAGYYNPVFDAAGTRVDSSYVVPDSILRVTRWEAYKQFEVTVPYELGRFITPYGKWFAKDREFDWVYDVTDFVSLLTDSTHIRVVYDGWSQGSLFSLDFEFIKGVPARDVFKVETIYAGGFRYGDQNDPIEAKLPARTISVPSESQHTTLRLVTSGHGFGGTDNAAEFSDYTHWVEVNGVRRFNQHLWRDDCGQNPVYPQAGTWYYPRGGWCPGDIVQPFIYDLTPFITPGSDAVLDYQMQPYTNLDPSHPASYYVQAQVMYSRGPNFTTDAELVEVRRPSTEFRFRRMNPVCGGSPPEIVIRNAGRDTLRSVVIDYGINGATPNRYTWQGRLNFLDTAVIALPGIPLGSTAGTFTVTLSEPNGAADSRPANNSITTNYAVPAVASNTLYVSVRADDFFDDPANTNGIEWEVVTVDGRQVARRGEMVDRTIYRDTLELTDGCYEFRIYDREFGDGLIPIRGTSGSYLIRDNKSRTIANGSSSGNYLASFGNREIIPFVVSGTSGVEPGQLIEPIRELFVWPNPSRGSVSVDMSELPPGPSRTLRVFSVSGEKVLELPVDAGRDTMAVDLAGQPAGVYTIQVSGEGATWSRRFILETREK